MRLAEIRRVELELCVGLVEDALELGVFPLDGVEGVVDEPAGGRDLVSRLFAVRDFDLRAGRELGAVLQRLPPGERGHPEDVLFDVVVAVFEFLADGLFVGGIGLDNPLGRGNIRSWDRGVAFRSRSAGRRTSRRRI